jgi:hypothetical protein
MQLGTPTGRVLTRQRLWAGPDVCRDLSMDVGVSISTHHSGRGTRLQWRRLISVRRINGLQSSRVRPMVIVKN